MIYTLTLNPSIDMNVASDRISTAISTRTRDMVLTPNGKGVNVSFVLRHLGKPVGALGFFGGFTGKYIVEQCENTGIKTIPVWIEGDTRVNVFLRCDEREYRFINEGASINADDEQALLSKLEALTDMDALTVNGSPAKNMSSDYYDKIINTAMKKGAKIILDISSPKLKELLKYRPLLIKPNDEELESIFGFKVTDVESIKFAVKEIRRMGAQNVLITLGEKGTYFYNGKDLFYCGIQPIKVRSTLCAGDGFLASFLSLWLENEENAEEALKLASATGANVAESDGLGDLKKIEQYKNNILVKKL